MASRNSDEGDATAKSVFAAAEESHAGDLLTIVYKPLQRYAGKLLRSRPRDFTPRATDLVHDALHKLFTGRGASFETTRHLFCVAAKAIRQVIMDHARRRARSRRGPFEFRVPLDSALQSVGRSHVDLARMNDIIEEVSRHDENLAALIELRFFAGLQVDEIAVILDTSKSTVERRLKAVKQIIKVMFAEEGAS